MIPYGRHHIDQQDIDQVIEVLKGDWLTCGPIIETFENELAQQVGAKHAIACSNGTTALHLAMLALNIGINDIVLVPAITFLASANAARYVGADVVFVDVDPQTGLMTLDTLKTAIATNKDKNLKAVVNVHLAGQCEDLEEIYKISRQHGLFIIEDAAHALGTTYTDERGKNHLIGANSFSDLTTFSFHPVKTIAMGEGGALTTQDSQIAARLKLLRSHGMVREASQWQGGETGPWYYEMQELGYNYRLSDINCALGVSQLKKLESFVAKRSGMVDQYDRAFALSSTMTPLTKLTASRTAWHLYIVLMDFAKIGLSRAEVMKQLKDKGIGTQVHYIPLYHQPYYKNLYGMITLPGAEAYYTSCLSLPLYASLTQKQQDAVIKAILNYA
ncbi:MAG: UDP-4-amino-4,6-dideoxy-N-acetyl-beta-L-altrosamine transaminase [Candidatus Paracaedibacteraceae bacterium]|nr:UDP-4-amino-4,6-dideoxy-N-acetyl-beta-L-altrosamine transaminase [Candidatus Paracaedibacteraceae bacterium]